MHLIQVIHPVPIREQYFSREQNGLADLLASYTPILLMGWKFFPWQSTPEELSLMQATLESEGKKRD